MASSAASKCLLHVLNSVITILSLALASASIWFFVQVKEFTNLRNSNHYLLDYNVYWTQVVPWLFFVVGIFAVCVSCCGFTSAKKNSRGFVTMYVVCLIIVILLLIAAAIISLVFADSKSTDDFVKDTVWDAYFMSKNDHDVAESFGNIEKKLHCCGADSPRDYKNWKTEFPQSCCDVYYRGWLDTYVLDCQFTNKLANERHGCSTVASQYARIAIKVLSAGSLLIAFICIVSLVVAIALSKAMKPKSRVLTHQNESESKKILI